MSLHISDKVKPAAKKDILELERKIQAFQKGEIPEDRFKAFRLTRGVYGQRQLGVQMVRIKYPYGRLTADQLDKTADVAEKFTNGNLHLTTRQDIQVHYIKVEDSPALWADLEQANITMREACGNTVRNVTGSAKAGIDPEEFFDISPYAQAVFEYFLRNPICQDMGRKFKIAFSSSDDDSAYTFIHDLGFIPRIKIENGCERRGFKVVLAGGLGSVARVADTIYEFLSEDKIIPLTEAVIRVFDRYGERSRRHYARLKFMVKKIGVEAFMKLVEEEQLALANQTYKIDANLLPLVDIPVKNQAIKTEKPIDEQGYAKWIKTNTFEQKQKGFYGVYAKVLLGNIHADKARVVAQMVRQYAADDIRVTMDQSFLFRYVQKESLPNIYNILHKLDLADYGYGTLADITSCPGTDTCNLAASSSTGLTAELENMISKEYEHLVFNEKMQIKISGCMNSCGQHSAANIGFHGHALKREGRVAPAMQLMLGGGIEKDGSGSTADKILPLPSKRAPKVLRAILDDFSKNRHVDETFNTYYRRQGKKYYIGMLKPMVDVSTISDEELLDWGEDKAFVHAVGTGECAGVMYDLVETIISDAKEKLELSDESLQEKLWTESIYHSYSTFIIGAKALLLNKEVLCNTHMGIVHDFQKHILDTGEMILEGAFVDIALQIKTHAPSESFAKRYNKQASDFMSKVLTLHSTSKNGDKKVVGSHYKA